MNFEHNWFYVPSEHIFKTQVIFPERTSHHVGHVLRKREGDVVSITDGQGNIYQARLMRARRSTIKAEIIEKKVASPLAPPYIDLAFVPLKGSRTEFIVEKSKELGVRKFLPFISQNAVIKEIKQAKIERIEHVMISAMIQSQQCFMSPILLIEDIHELVRKFKAYDRVLITDPSGSQDIIKAGKSLLLVIGPEGGFERDEMTLFTRSGATLFSLGPRRLRSETAAIAGIVKVLAKYGVM